MEQFATALHVFSATFGSILKVLAVIFLPISLLESVILGRMNTASVALQAVTQAADVTTANVEKLSALLFQVMTQEFLLFAIALFLQPVGIIAIAKITKQYIDGEKIEAGKAISEALNQMPAIIITGLIFGVLVFLGSLVIVPGVYFGIAWALYYFCIAFEEKKGMEALRSSKALVQGKWLRTAGYLFLLSFVSVLWNSVFEVICSFLGDGLAANLLYQALCYISVGFVAVGQCLLYLNRKAVKEGACVFDSGYIDGTAEETTDAAEEEKNEHK